MVALSRVPSEDLVKPPSEGKTSDADDAQSSSNPGDLVARVALRKERNRQSAASSRKRQKLRTEELEEENGRLVHENKCLRLLLQRHLGEASAGVLAEAGLSGEQSPVGGLYSKLASHSGYAHASPDPAADGAADALPPSVVAASPAASCSSTELRPTPAELPEALSLLPIACGRPCSRDAEAHPAATATLLKGY